MRNAETLLNEMLRISNTSIKHYAVVHGIVQYLYPAQKERLYTLAFKAKFITQSFAILRRLPKQDDKRDAINRTFQEELETIKEELFAISMAISPQQGTQFKGEFLQQTIESFSSLIELLHDIAWIQNLHIDDKNNDGTPRK